MSETASAPHTADANQLRASDPTASAWVSANAGTGKTEVLVRRSLRLLLAGATPESILCLTYTKMAAAEMQNRLLKELAAWATIATEELRSRLAALIGTAPEEATLRAARRLFARALEARGGLKIYTIHGFCERLLQRFPLEAEVAPQFAVLDEAAAARLRGEAFDAIMARAASQRDGPLGRALGKIVAVTSEDYFRQMVDAVLAKRAELIRMVALHGGDPDWTEAETASLKRLFGVAEGETESALTEALAAVLDNGTIDSVSAALEAGAGGADDKRLQQALLTARTASGLARAEALKQAFLTAELEPRKRICSKVLRTAEPELCAKLDAAQLRFAALQAKRGQLASAEASAALLLLAEQVQARYEHAKRMQAVLDYEDLILKARSLLSVSGAASWVLYKIDGGIDHILVDEAQDTNPAQWSIIAALAQEFFAGEGAKVGVRTLFAVGDEKQSIYSFQGAAPARFGLSGRAFRAKAREALLEWHEVPLTLSFRSTEPILTAVDAVFGKSPAAEGLTWDETAVIRHLAFRQGHAGLVELWPVATEARAMATGAFEPWNDEAPSTKAVDSLCQRIALHIKDWLDRGEELVSAGRKIRPGDILILVRRRDPFTAPMIRALKRAHVRVAGADRMRLLQQVAVMDLVALADLLLMPEDDLALAIVLKSPLFGLDDDTLFDLGFARSGSLWATLRAKADDPRFAEAARELTRWLACADFTPPYEFFLELLEQRGEDGRTMRQRMLTRLGPEAAEALDEFLDLALAHDREAAPSLQGFVNHLRLSDIEIKRDMEQERDEVRIMTVHGAKGLQAPIVFLPDTCMLPRRQGASLHSVPRPEAPRGEVAHLIWAAGTKNLLPVEAAKGVARQAELQEYHRLLYVAMTRARDRLYVCGWCSSKDEAEAASWYDLVWQGLNPLLTEMKGADGTTVWRLESKQTVPVKPAAPSGTDIEAAEPPVWARTPAPPERSRPVLVPSRLAPHSADDEPVATEQPQLGPSALAANLRFARGRLVHTLLQYMPEVDLGDRETAARALVAARGAALPDSMQAEIVGETLAIVQDPQFGPLFGPGSLSEVPVVARLGEGEASFELSGQIDRLAVLEDHLLILDYKTNRPPPLTPETVAPGYVAQLAAYRLALRGLFPERGLRAAIVWTDGPRLMEISSTLLDDAERRILERSPSLDVAKACT
jgi:ATP-dependent helicase/nuclease subunit A